MEITLRAIIDHIFHIPGLIDVEEYNGQIKNGVIKKTVKLPAALVQNKDGTVRRNPKGMNFDILVLTETKVFDKKKNNHSNLEMVTKVMDHLDENPGFTFTNIHDRTKYSYLIDQETIKATKLMTTDRFMVYVISFNIRYL